MKQSFMRTIVLFAVATIATACSSDAVVQPTPSPLAGLNHSESGDTATVNHSPTGTGPGYFRGTVLGPSSPGAGNDSLNTAPKIAGVVVTIYERKTGGADTVAIGDAKGSATTGADGKFTLPTLPAGEYVVTFVPPANSGYYGAYALGPLRENSSDFPWWVVLAKK
jgi:hypothetical protein